MRILTRSNSGFAAAVVVGLFIAWMVAVPARVTGERLHGRCQSVKYCTSEVYIYCTQRCLATP